VVIRRIREANIRYAIKSKKRIKALLDAGYPMNVACKRFKVSGQTIKLILAGKHDGKRTSKK
jgi:hypothetical protein